MGSQKLGAYEVRYKWKIQNSITSVNLIEYEIVSKIGNGRASSDRGLRPKPPFLLLFHGKIALVKLGASAQCQEQRVSAAEVELQQQRKKRKYGVCKLR